MLCGIHWPNILITTFPDTYSLTRNFELSSMHTESNSCFYPAFTRNQQSNHLVASCPLPAALGLWPLRPPSSALLSTSPICDVCSPDSQQQPVQPVSACLFHPPALTAGQPPTQVASLPLPQSPWSLDKLFSNQPIPTPRPLYNLMRNLCTEDWKTVPEVHIKSRRPFSWLLLRTWAPPLQQSDQVQLKGALHWDSSTHNTQHTRADPRPVLISPAGVHNRPTVPPPWTLPLALLTPPQFRFWDIYSICHDWLACLFHNLATRNSYDVILNNFTGN